MVSTSHSAECTALRAHTMPIAPISASGARTQKVTSSPPETSPAAASTVVAVMPPLPCLPPPAGPPARHREGHAGVLLDLVPAGPIGACSAPAEVPGLVSAPT